jgi:proline dehydrogenase|tara:strand:- start:157 stop:1056 length:900 start_codon:yes stop_codon:yes gene_type:complete
MSWVNSSIAVLMPYLPKWFARPFAKPYVAGESIESVTEIVRSINRNGFSTTLDILGEHIHTPNEANEILNQYIDLIKNISNNDLDSTISIKLTHLGLSLDKQLAKKNFTELVTVAKNYNIGITIDMENSTYTTKTLKFFKKGLEIHEDVGTVIQAYLHRSLDDLKELDSSKLNLRICKGIYSEAPEIAIQDRKKINDNFIKIAETLLLGQGYACLATHDLELIDQLEELIKKYNISKDRFEFQALYGVPMGNRLELLKEKGFKIRIYVPFGEAWFDYSIRRLKENPKIISYILTNIFKK